MSIYRNCFGNIISTKSNAPALHVNPGLDPSFNPSQDYITEQYKAFRWMFMTNFLQTRVDTLLPVLFIREPWASALELEQSEITDRFRTRQPELLALLDGSSKEEDTCELVKRVLGMSTDRLLERNLTRHVYLSRDGFRPADVVDKLPSLLRSRLRMTQESFQEKFLGIAPELSHFHSHR